MIFTTSWDDGSTYDNKLLDLLKPLGIKGTLYIPQKSKHRTLNDVDVKFLSQYFEIGGHSISHMDLTTLDSLQTKREVNNSKLYIESIIKNKCLMFCYPFGQFNTKIKRIVRNAGFVGARIINQDFCDGTILNNFHLPTSIQVCKHTKEITRKFNETPSVKNSLSNQFLKNIDNFNINENNEYSWLDIALFVYKEIKKIDGVFHLWGHSWEIEEQNLWKELESFLTIIVKDNDIKFYTNSELIIREQ